MQASMPGPYKLNVPTFDSLCDNLTIPVRRLLGVYVRQTANGPETLSRIFRHSYPICTDNDSQVHA